MESCDAAVRKHLEVGDLRAAGTLIVERLAHEVLGLCQAMVRDPSVAEDLAQDIFSRAFSALGGFRGDASVRTWLLTITRNRCIDHIRARQRDVPLFHSMDETDDPDQQPDEAPLPSDLIARRGEVREAMAELAEGERALVVLRYRHGLDYRELAVVFGLREGAVRMRLCRALARMRRSLARPVLARPAAQPSFGAPAQQSAQRQGPAPGRRPPPPQPPAPPKHAPARRPPPMPRQEEPTPPPPPRAAPAPSAPRPAAPPAPQMPPSVRAPGPPAGPPTPPPPTPGPFPTPPAPINHPLPSVLALLDPGLPPGLRRRLMETAGSL